jgi:hypothetical protein
VDTILTGVDWRLLMANAPSHRRAGAEFGVSQAKAARDVIARFGRHPHRNEILGRDSTPEELEYLRTETPPHLRRPPFLLSPYSPSYLEKLFGKSE